MVDTRKSWISGKGPFSTRMIMLGRSSEKVQGNEVHSRVKAALAHLGSSEGRSSAPQEGIFGDQNTAHPSCGERCIDAWCRDGHRRRLGARPSVVQETTNGGARCYIYRRPNSTSTELVYTGEIVPGWKEDFTALWKEAMDEANLRE